MIRSLIPVALAFLVVGCTRFGTNPAGGPFLRKPKPLPEPYSAIPPAPPATNAPLAIGSPTLPAPELAQAGGILVPDKPVPPKRRDPSERKLPRPFAKDRTSPEPAVSTPATKLPSLPGYAAVPEQVASPGHIAEVKELVEAAAARWSTVNCYEATVTRRELAPNKKVTEDVVLYRFRKAPMAVYIKNLGEAGKGREILYFPSKHDDRIYSIIGKGDENFLLKVGDRAPAVSPDMPLVKSKTRYSIREAGHGTPIARLNGWVAKAEFGQIPAENLTYLGEVKRREFPYPLIGVQLELRPGDDPLMPRGGTRQWYFDPSLQSQSHHLPVLIIALEPGGKEVEYYHFEKMDFSKRFSDADFDPARLGK
jgi:hypothetical protein